MDDPDLPRREFLKAALATGGAGALAACLDREPSAPRGTTDPADYPERQHAWNAALATDEAGNPRQPRHHLLLLLEYEREGPPIDADREAFAAALRSLERAYARSHGGLLFTVGYAPAYFERFDASLPDSVDLPAPRALAPFEDPDLDDPDAVCHLASDLAHVPLAAEEALRGRRDTVNGVAADALPDALSVRERRTGFVGAGLPADNQDVAGVPDAEPVPEDAPLYMGFQSGFERAQASEDRVTIDDGPFAGGTTQHLSRIGLNLTQWYEQDDRDQRVAKMFCPAHAAEERVEGVGANLGTDSGVTDCDPAEETARDRGVVGHSQKLVAVREDDEPLILRRDFDTTDGDRAGLHFLALQAGIADFVRTREAMNGADLVGDTAVGRRNNNGILQYMDVERRGNYLLPPRSLRALPPANPEGLGPEGTGPEGAR